MKKLIVGLLTVAALGVVSLPAHSDEATIFDNSQNCDVAGNNNNCTQTNVQQNQQVGRHNGNRGTVMRNNQNCVVTGDGNNCTQTSVQQNQQIRPHRNRY